MTRRLLLAAAALGALGVGCSSGPKPVPNATAAAPAASAPQGQPTGLPPPKVTPPATTDTRTRDTFAQAVKLAQAGDVAGAERALGDVLSRDPSLDHAWTDLGVLAERKGDLAAAEKDYRQALALSSGPGGGLGLPLPPVVPAGPGPGGATAGGGPVRRRAAPRPGRATRWLSPSSNSTSPRTPRRKPRRC